MLEVNHLTKRYGDKLAVDDLSFKLESNTVYGLLGPNGAGKSTTMNIIAGCLAATSGSVSIGGFDIFEQPIEAKRLLGYLPELPPVYMERTPDEYLTFVARAKGIPEDKVKAEVEKALKATGTVEVRRRLCRNLSKGYRQRVGIAQAIIGDPQVIVLDEPTVGLDPIQIIEIRDLIKELGKEHTVVLSSHILSEVQSVCQQIMIINKGRMVACDTAENLEKLFSTSLEIELKVKATAEEAKSLLDGSLLFSEVEVTDNGDGTCGARCKAVDNDQDNIVQALFVIFSQAGKAILMVTPHKASLEDIFIELTETEPSTAPAAPTAPAEQPAEEVESI